MLKKDLRALYKEKRLALEISTRKLWETEILSHLRTFIKDHPEIQHINIFVPIEKWKEINTFWLKQGLDQMQLVNAWSTPKMTDKTGGMEMLLWEVDANFKMNDWGIPELESSTAVAPDTIDLILVPLLIFDSKGHRVGYGKGFYDRYLAQSKGIKLGLSYFEGIERISDVDVNDVALDYVITPNGIQSFK